MDRPENEQKSRTEHVVGFLSESYIYIIKMSNPLDSLNVHLYIYVYIYKRITIFI